MTNTEIVIITGLSGAGKSAAISLFEDLGFNCVDNMPPMFISKFIEACATATKKFNKIAIVVDSRAGELFDSFYDELKLLAESDVKLKIIYLEASDDVLVKRYKETRRRHPLIDTVDGILSDAIKAERRMLSPIRELSDFVIDTSFLSNKALREDLRKKIPGHKSALCITIMSFGQKYGPQTDVDMQFDVRCLPNPYYKAELRAKTGLDDDVYDYVFGFTSAKDYYNRVFEMLISLLPQFEFEGKTNITVAFCCTGGKHRSVSFARKLGEDMDKRGCNISVIHRDIDKV